MDKKIKKPMRKTPRETFSLDEESIEIIDSEIEDAQRQGFEIKRSAVIRKALQLLKAHKESVQSAQIQAQQGARQLQAQGQKKIKDSRKK